MADTPDQKEKDKKEAEVFAHYVATKKVLIVDPNAAARSSLFYVFKQLGAKTSQLFLVNTFQQAEQIMPELKPEIVVAEYNLGKRCGLELLQSQRSLRPNETKSNIFVVVTENSSQTAAARSLEEDIDAYIIKPYTLENVRKTLLRTAMFKLRPPEYILKIEHGKELLAAGLYKEAESAFEEATALDAAPSLACYYLGQVKLLREVLNEAETEYNRGLKFNRIHYRCLVGLYELLMKEQKNHEAYQVVKKISKYFPANPKRLSEVLKLAIVTGQYDDIEQYYAVFSSLDDRNDLLIRYTCAALVVCGKYYLSTKLGHLRAVELFRKAAVSGAGRIFILKEIIQALLDYNLNKEAANFLTKFPPEAFNSEEFLLLRFLIFSKTGDLGLVLDQGRSLIGKHAVDERLYTVMIQKSLEAGLAPAAEDLVTQASVKFPAKKEFFLNLLKAPVPSTT